MKNILLPTDFSDNAYNAVTYAVQMFQQEKCVFHLLHCYTPVYYDTDFIQYSPASTLSLNDVHRKSSKKELGKIRMRIRNEFPNELHNFRLITSFKPLRKELRNQAKILQPDAIIMGTQGATGAKQILFGSHTVHAIKRTSFPLIAIPSGYKFIPPKNILLPSDFEINYTRHHLRLLLFLVKNFNSEIHILHVSFGSHFNEELENGKKLLTRLLGKVPHKFCFIERSTVPEGISNFQKENSTELLAMISNKHTFLENLLFRPVTNEIGFQIKTPFLVIPSGKFNK